MAARGQAELHLLLAVGRQLGGGVDVRPQSALLRAGNQVKQQQTRTRVKCLKILRSENLEGLGELSVCVTDVPKVGGWQVYTENGEWTTDNTFVVECEE